MKQAFKSGSFTLIALAAVLFLSPACQSTKSEDSSSTKRGGEDDTLVWCGLDYSDVKMIGTEGFRQPDEIFPQMLFEWNSLFMQEMFPAVQGLTKSVKSDLSAISVRNQQVTAKQIDLIDGTYDTEVRTTHITQSDIAAIVASYKLEDNKGIGLVFIMDRLVKAQHAGCLYIVYFDIASRKILYSERAIAGAHGGTFRNFWFRPIKFAVQKLPRTFKAAKKAKFN